MNKSQIEFDEFLKDYCEFPDKNYEISYVGLKIEKDNNKRFKFVFPFMYYTDYERHNLKEDAIKLDIENLLKAIYKTNISEKYNDYNKSLENNCPIDSYLWIIKNYLVYGYYVENELTYSKIGKGKIDWKKTIKNNKFYITDDLNIIYSEYIKKQTVKNVNSIITNIHKYCVYESVRIFGPFCGINLQSVEKPEIEMQEEYMLYYLKNEYSKTFLDSKKELLKNMISILEWLNNENMSYDMFSIESNKFELVFERLIDEKFGNVDDIAQYYPTSVWHIGDEDYESSKLREDTLLNLAEERKFIIIDSKYYKYAYYDQTENVNRLPTTSSIAKQIIYGEYVNKYINKNVKRQKDNSVNVYNIFLIPFNKSKKDLNDIQYVGYAYSNWKSDENEEKATYEKIYTFKIDLKNLVNDRLGTKNNCIKTLNRKLEEVLGKIELN